MYTEVTIFSIEECDIYYTLDESDPKKNGILYTDAGIELDDVGKYTIKAVCKTIREFTVMSLPVNIRPKRKPRIIRK